MDPNKKIVLKVRFDEASCANKRRQNVESTKVCNEKKERINSLLPKRSENIDDRSDKAGDSQYLACASTSSEKLSPHSKPHQYKPETSAQKPSTSAYGQYSSYYIQDTYPKITGDTYLFSTFETKRKLHKQKDKKKGICDFSCEENKCDNPYSSFISNKHYSNYKDSQNKKDITQYNIQLPIIQEEFDEQPHHRRLLPKIYTYNKNVEEDVNEHMLIENNPFFDEYQPGYSRAACNMEERNIIDEFCRQLDTSRQHFIAIRELPEYAVKDWSSHFRRVFEIYTQVWKYQQQHRELLIAKYGLKRWQIGEIASKIGQLYYFYYKRTSNIDFLNDAFAFYSIIRERNYYTKAIREDKCELMIKKLRYYHRFIVVCLLQRRMNLVKDLIMELDHQILEYGNAYNHEDQVDWLNTSENVKAFLDADPVVYVTHVNNYPVTLSYRITPAIIPPITRTPQMNLSLQEIVLVGSSPIQLKVDELSMDIYKMIQILEKQPTRNFYYTPALDDSPPTERRYFMAAQNIDRLQYDRSKAVNPHRYVLFTPSVGQLLTHIASAFTDVAPNGTMLLYISADGYYPQPSKYVESEEDVSDEAGGLLLAASVKNVVRDRPDRDAPTCSEMSNNKQFICAKDLVPFTRKPMLVILDSDNSYSFHNISRCYEQPLVVLMSPIEIPADFHERKRKGNLFTLFLHSPLTAICYICERTDVPLEIWERAQSILERYMAEATSIFVRSRVDPSFIGFMGDEFMRLLIVRFVLCETVLRQHRAFSRRPYRTKCSPPLPDELYNDSNLRQILMELASLLQVRNFFD
ncbi:hypothetical protein ACJJTC_000995 [Scirpophaga incertulas]